MGSAFLRPFTRAGRRFDVCNRAVFISGGSRGLGLEIAHVFGARGARVAICGRDAEELERARTALGENRIHAFTVVADMRRKEASRNALQATEAQLGAIDVLVNTTGTIAAGPFDAFAHDDYRDAMDAHFWAPLYAIDTLKPAMRARRSGRIVNIASIGGRVSVPHRLPDSASSFALVGLSEGLRAELIRDGVYVTTVITGLMRPARSDAASFSGRNRLENAGLRIADSLPWLSVDAMRAAQAIVDATERGDAALTLSVPARILSLVHGLFPGPLTELVGLVARVLPPPGSGGRGPRPGYESHTALSRSSPTAQMP